MASLPMRACPRYRPYSAVNMAWSLARFVLLDEGVRWAAAVLAVSASPPPGTPWLVPLNPATGVAREVIQAPVLWVDFDNGPRRTDERVAAVGRAYQLPPTTPFHYVSMPSPWLDAHKVGARPLLCDCLPSDGAQRAHASVPRMRPAAVSVCMTMTPCTWDERAASRAAQA
jgi:hypothetical protein